MEREIKKGNVYTFNQIGLINGLKEFVKNKFLEEMTEEEPMEILELLEKINQVIKDFGIYRAKYIALSGDPDEYGKICFTLLDENMKIINNGHPILINSECSSIVNNYITNIDIDINDDIHFMINHDERITQYLYSYLNDKKIDDKTIHTIITVEKKNANFQHCIIISIEEKWNGLKYVVGFPIEEIKKLKCENPNLIKIDGLKNSYINTSKVISTPLYKIIDILINEEVSTK